MSSAGPTRVICFQEYVQAAKDAFEGLDDDVEKIAAASINTAMRDAKKQWIEKVNKRYAFKPGKEPGKDKKMGRIIARRGGGKHANSIEVLGPATNLFNMESTPGQVPRPRRSGSFPGVNVRVLRSSGMTGLGGKQPRAFVTSFKSGHMAIVERASTGLGSSEGKHAKPDSELSMPGHWAKREKLPRGLKDLTKIEKLKSVSMAQMFGHDAVRIPFAEEFMGDFDAAFDKALQRRLNRARKGTL